jgi:hypothetical protein
MHLQNYVAVLLSLFLLSAISCSKEGSFPTVPFVDHSEGKPYKIFENGLLTYEFFYRFDLLKRIKRYQADGKTSEVIRFYYDIAEASFLVNTFIDDKTRYSILFKEDLTANKITATFTEFHPDSDDIRQEGSCEFFFEEQNNLFDSVHYETVVYELEAINSIDYSFDQGNNHFYAINLASMIPNVPTLHFSYENYFDNGAAIISDLNIQMVLFILDENYFSKTWGLSNNNWVARTHGDESRTINYHLEDKFVEVDHYENGALLKQLRVEYR